jgi:hypothetical protein
MLFWLFFWMQYEMNFVQLGSWTGFRHYSGFAWRVWVKARKTCCCLRFYRDDSPNTSQSLFRLRHLAGLLINPLTPELNPPPATLSDEIFLLGIFLEPCSSLICVWKTNKCNCFGITLPSSGSVSSGFWEMLSWGAVDRILWMGVLCLVTWCACAPHH